MARLLYAWELGGGYGHVVNLWPVVAEYARVAKSKLPAVEVLVPVTKTAWPSGLTVTETYTADGKEGNLNLYALLRREREPSGRAR